MKNMKIIILLSQLGILFFIICLLGIQIYVISDLFFYEYHYLSRLLGNTGLIVITIFNMGILLWAVFVSRAILKLDNRKYRSVFLSAFAIWTIVILWGAEWVFMEKPVTVRITQNIKDDNKIEKFNSDELQARSSFLNKKTSNIQEKEKLVIMYERVKLNRPNIYKQYDIDTTISKYSLKYNVEPELLFYWLYLNSFYGEAVSGKVPFFNEMTAETFRDLIQVHLPAWFVESSLRQYLINSTLLQKIFGEHLGEKLRYAFQKATYDVSTEPYDTNTYTDTYLILKKYKNEFQDVFSSSEEDVLNTAIKVSFNKLEADALFDPCFPIYKNISNSPLYYEKHRDDLKDFARAIFYKTLFDFDFATRVQALVAKNINDRYEEKLGESYWQKVSMEQKMSMSAMIRDIYVPNIGKLSHNLYNLPEFNCSPFEFVSQESINDKDELLKSDVIWRPREYQRLWSAATSRLRVLSEVLEVVNGRGLSGVEPVNTTKQSLDMVLMNKQD